MAREARSSGVHGAGASPRVAGAGAGVAVGKQTRIEQLPAGVPVGAVQRRAGAGEPHGPATPDAVRAAAAHGTSGAGGPLPYRDAIQRAFGRHDVSGIGAHVGGRAAEGAAQMGAAAYATGEQVAFAGAPTLHDAAHEAAHVVQQRAGVALAGGVGEAGDAYERRADAIADRVVQGASAEDLLDGAGPAAASAGAAVQRKVKVGDEVRAMPTLEDVAKTDRAQQVLQEMVDADPEYAFGDEEELGTFVAEVARTDWGAPPTDVEQTPDVRVKRFAEGRVGQHVWASDHRQDGDLRVTRTNTLNKRFQGFKTRSGLPETSHRIDGTVPPPETRKKLGTTQHVYSAMMTSLSPAAGDERATANTDVREGRSVMNCEQFVAYSLWGGGVIKDWELALIFAACARENKMAYLYRAMGLGVAQRVTPVGASLQLGAPQQQEEPRPLGAVSALFETTDPDDRLATVSHMLLFTGAAVIELNAGRDNPEQWKVAAIPMTSYAERHTDGKKAIFACPVTDIPAQLQATLRVIAETYPGDQLLAPKRVEGEPTEDQQSFGFLTFARG